jgi:sn-glycerol 3-phosphate transport system permease protein
LRKRLAVIPKTVWWALTAALALLIFFPFWYMISMSVTPDSDILSNNVSLWPAHLYFGNIVKALTQTPLVRQFLNTLVVSLAILLLQIVTSVMAAYAFAFLEFKGKKALFLVILSTMMVPGEVTIISNYLTVGSWHWLDTYQALILPYAASALGIFLIRQYFLTMAKEIHEAAMIDGCGNVLFLVKIAVPLARPIIAAFSIASFLSSWGLYMWPLLVTSKSEMRMVQVGISALQDADSALSFGIALAGVAIVTLPSLIVFILGHKQLVEGMMSGAVKG